MDQNWLCSGLRISLPQKHQDPAEKKEPTGHLTLSLYYHYPLRLMTNSNMEKLLLKQM